MVGGISATKIIKVVFISPIEDLSAKFFYKGILVLHPNSIKVISIINPINYEARKGYIKVFDEVIYWMKDN